MSACRRGWREICGPVAARPGGASPAGGGRRGRAGGDGWVVWVRRARRECRRRTDVCSIRRSAALIGGLTERWRLFWNHTCTWRGVTFRSPARVRRVSTLGNLSSWNTFSSSCSACGGMFHRVAFPFALRGAPPPADCSPNSAPASPPSSSASAPSNDGSGGSSGSASAAAAAVEPPCILRSFGRIPSGPSLIAAKQAGAQLFFCFVRGEEAAAARGSRPRSAAHPRRAPRKGSVPAPPPPRARSPERHHVGY